MHYNKPSLNICLRKLKNSNKVKDKFIKAYVYVCVCYTSRES